MSEPGKDRLLDHDHDGIREYDNRRPKWRQYTLYGAMVFAVLCWLIFHTFGVLPLSGERYDDEMAASAEAQLARMAGQELNDDILELMALVPERVAEGRQVFEQLCVQCHLTSGAGSVGPNLTDDYWLQGGSAMDIHRTVTHGVPEKGMVAWESQLGPRRVQAVVAFVLTLRGQNLPGKKPEGELWLAPDRQGGQESGPAESSDATDAGAPEADVAANAEASAKEE